MSSHTSTLTVADLARLRTQAKELLRAAQASSLEARERFHTHHPQFRNSPNRIPKLTDAQLVLAREHGFPSWPRLVVALQSAQMDLGAKADAFVEAAIAGKLAKARALLDDTPELAKFSIYSAAAYGDADALRGFLAREGGLANAAGGPRQRLPLLYAVFSRFFQDAERRPHLLASVKLLIDAGADPNASYREAPFEDFPLSALYGAAGVLHDAELAEMLLDAGANPNDNESLYHSVEQAANECTALLLRRGADPNATNALAHQLDYEDSEGLRLFLSHGADPNRSSPTGGNSLHWAILRRRGPDCIGLLVEYGADMEARSAEGWTPFRQAALTGQTEIAALLESRGANSALTEEDRIIAALALGDLSVLSALRQTDPDQAAKVLQQSPALLAESAEHGRIEAVRALLDLGVSPDSRGANHATALHWACWRAHADVVRLLTARGAALESVGADFGTTPMQWAIHGANNNQERPWEAFEDTLRAMLDAGAAWDPAWLEDAGEKLRAFFIPFSSSPVIIS
ncbi:hypothetical protein CCAX7_36900 [Capsulimonas corticalis]|uniref:Uncharacterized protein n=1 Tax=Capsulimonas corticalis TaxID=2219043 RepID=A0A402D1B2_9BACT|nr:ankyrin repeat domain-containing protein [Capsulimonas corticalis]BDI31639.1 hypothetical protein CCAX7_36900 [Capsulimonas corticalis]